MSTATATISYVGVNTPTSIAIIGNVGPMVERRNRHERRARAARARRAK